MAEAKKQAVASGATTADKRPDDKKTGAVKREKGKMPEELIGCENAVGGKFVCFGYNMRAGCPSKDVKAGARVLFGTWSGTEVKLDGEHLLIMKESDIMGIIG